MFLASLPSAWHSTNNGKTNEQIRPHPPLPLRPSFTLKCLYHSPSPSPWRLHNSPPHSFGMLITTHYPLTTNAVTHNPIIKFSISTIASSTILADT